MSENSEKKIKEMAHKNYYEISLNRPKKINVLDEELVEDFIEAINRFEKSESQQLIITGQGEKGFCAGGDVVSVISGVKSGREEDFFFKKEYSLDQMIHGLKNTVGFAHGIVMGGGMGILMGCTTRILDPKCILAMPEVTIGFFPDVGATYFLQKIPNYWRVFLTQTGARLNALETYRIGLADALVSYDGKDDFLEGKVIIEDETKKNLKTLSREEDEFILKDRWLKEAYENSWADQESFDQWIEAELKKDLPLKWMKQSLDIYCSGSPVSKVISWDLFKWSQGKSLVDCFKMDLSIVGLISRHGDFEEGVRALLIDKDKNPQWKDKNILDSRTRIQESLSDLFKTFS